MMRRKQTINSHENELGRGEGASDSYEQRDPDQIDIQMFSKEWRLCVSISYSL